MKQITKLLILIAVGYLFWGFVPMKKDVPPGTTYFKDNLYVDVHEVSNISWLEYVSWMKRKYGKHSDEYKASLPDTTVWGGEMAPFTKYYFGHVAYRDYPVVGISYEQAVAYCKWRSRQVNTFLFIKNNKGIEWDINSSYEDAPQIYNYRLPTKEEFEEIAKIGFKTSVQRKIDKKGLAKYNCIRNSVVAQNDDSLMALMTVTAPVGSYFPNEQGVYNVLGNVAEIVAEKGVAKGGSWMHTEDDMNASLEFTYDKPESWLGFRCVCEKKEL